MNRSRPSSTLPPGEVRVIGGDLRGSKLPVADAPGLRPTSARVRETLFNWLQHEVAGRRVLDLFAGTGALGFEAASRGAAAVQMVERDARLAESLGATAARLKAGTVQVACDDALAWLARPGTARFDLVLLDPPFALGLWQQATAALGPWLAERAWVYVETGLDTPFTAPAGWQLHRQGETRDVRFRLFRVVPLGQLAESAGTLQPDPAQ